MSRYLVDGMNVIGSRPDGWWRDRAGAVVRLIGELEDWAARTGADVRVVFDGEPPGDTSAAETSVDVAFSGRGTVADDVIAKIVADDPDASSLTVITSDGELARRVRVHGAPVMGAGAFRRLLDG